MRIVINKIRIMRNLSVIILFILSVPILGQVKQVLRDSLETIKPNMVSSTLDYPFGTLLTMEVLLVNGDDTRLKQYQGAYLLKIVSIENKKVNNPITLVFRDETGKFPNDLFKLYKYLYGKDIGSITSDIQEKIEKRYIGKTFRVIAYETGGFVGIPDGYFKYQPIRQDTGFHFDNYLIIVADLTEPQKSNTMKNTP